MQDVISTVVNRYDLVGKYLDQTAMSEIQEYFKTGSARIIISEAINSQTSQLLKKTAEQFYLEQPELLRPGGNSYTTRRYAACLRDIEYYLRYASYAIIAGNISILDERVLDGLRETYNSLGVPIGPTIRSLELLKETIKTEITSLNDTIEYIIDEPFNYMIKVISEQDI